MTRSEAIKDLIINLSISLLVGIIFSIIMVNSMGGGDFSDYLLMILPNWIVLGGIPSGWSWASKIVTAVSFPGIMMKLIISIFLGWIALPVRIVKDIIAIISNK